MLLFIPVTPQPFPSSLRAGNDQAAPPCPSRGSDAVQDRAVVWCSICSLHLWWQHPDNPGTWNRPKQRGAWGTPHPSPDKRGWWGLLLRASLSTAEASMQDLAAPPASGGRDGVNTFRAALLIWRSAGIVFLMLDAQRISGSLTITPATSPGYQLKKLSFQSLNTHKELRAAAIHIK